MTPLLLALVLTVGDTPVKTSPGVTLTVQGAAGGVPIPVTTTGGGGGTQSVQGVDGGYSVGVSGTFWQATQPVSAASLPLPTGAATDRATAAAPNSCRLSDGAAFYKGTTPSDTQPVSGTFWQATQPVSAASLPLPTGAAQDRVSPSASPFACRITDGAAFYNTVTGGQLPTALDGSGFLKTHEQGTATVSGTVALGAGSAVVGHVITDTGSTSAVTGNVTVVQPTGTNLHAVLDTTSTTAVTQATGTNLHAVLDSTSTTAVTQATGTNLHTVVDSAPTTAVTNAIQDPAYLAPASTSAPAKAPVVMGKTADGTPAYDPIPLAAGGGSVVISGTATVSGTSTVSQATGTNLHAVLDATSTTAVTQATGTNLHAVLDATSTTAVTQATGTNLHTVVDSAPTTAVTSAIQDPAYIAPAATSAPSKAVVVMGKSADGTPVYNPLPLAVGSGSVVVSGTVALGTGSAVVGHVINDASSAVIGHVIADTGSTTAVTGNVAVTSALQDPAYLAPASTSAPTKAPVVMGKTADGTPAYDPLPLAAGGGSLVVSGTSTVSQATGTNLHAVLDTTSTTAVTQATGTNLHAVLDTTSTTACTQATGTNLHVVTDATSVLAANQSVNMAQVAGTNTVNGGVAGTLGAGGVSATNTAITQNPMLIAAEANDGAAQPAAATTGRQRQLVSTVDGQLVVRPFGTVVWHCSLNAIAASLTQCQAVPGAGLSLYVTDLVVVTTTTTAGTYSWQTGTGSNCGTGTAAVFPGDATGTRFTAPISTSPPTVIHFGTPIKLAANTELCLIGVATNTIHAEATGFSAP